MYLGRSQAGKRKPLYPTRPKLLKHSTQMKNTLVRVNWCLEKHILPGQVSPFAFTPRQYFELGPCQLGNRACFPWLFCWCYYSLVTLALFASLEMFWLPSGTRGILWHHDVLRRAGLIHTASIETLAIRLTIYPKLSWVTMYPCRNSRTLISCLCHLQNSSGLLGGSEILKKGHEDFVTVHHCRTRHISQLTSINFESWLWLFAFHVNRWCLPQFLLAEAAQYHHSQR